MSPSRRGAPHTAMHDARPETRAAFLKDALATFDVLPAPQAAAARAGMPARSARRIREAGRLEWLPARCALDILEAIDAAAGDDGVRRCSTAAIEATLRAPLLRGFVEAARATLRPTPRAFLRAVVAAWPLHYRAAGDLVVSDEEGGVVRVLHAGIPRELRARPWTLSMATCLERVAAVAAADARAEVETARGAVSYVVRVR